MAYAFKVHCVLEFAELHTCNVPRVQIFSQRVYLWSFCLEKRRCAHRPVELGAGLGGAWVQLARAWGAWAGLDYSQLGPMLV